MKKFLFSFAAFVVLMSFAGSLQAQDYCLWIVNDRYDDLYELKVKKITSNTFSADLLPSDMGDTGKAFWIKVSNRPNDLGDVQITDENGDPLMFTLNTVSGGVADFPYIRLNFKDIHTLVLNDDNTFTVYNNDEYDLGHPCDN